MYLTYIRVSLNVLEYSTTSALPDGGMAIGINKAEPLTN